MLIKQMHDALGVIVKTPEIATYLAQHDPMALRQVRAAFEAASAEFIRQYLGSIGWTADEEGRMVDPHTEKAVDLSGDSSYVWELKGFSDGDIDGVATARWVGTDIVGDTVEELQALLRK